jgi:hypothetical protein
LLRVIGGWMVKKKEEGTNGKKLKYPWGDAFDENKCNTYESGIRGTTPTGKYSPAGDSPYGCVDMVGNVWEWTSSLYKEYPYNAEMGGRSGIGRYRVCEVARGALQISPLCLPLFRHPEPPLLTWVSMWGVIRKMWTSNTEEE